MIWKNRTYKGVSLSDTQASTNRIAIQDVNKNVWLRTEIYTKQNYHWVNTSNTLAEWRLFTFDFAIFGTREERAKGQEVLNSIIVPENNPGSTDWLYTLQWDTDDGETVSCQARVYGMPNYDSIDPGDHIITGSFELFAPNPEYYSATQKTNSSEYGRRGWFKLDTTFDFKMNELLAEIVVDNTGNFSAPMKINVVGSIDNPVITNVTTGSFYGLDKTTTDLIIDGTGNSFIVTDDWVNAKASRKAGSEIVRLIPWTNKIIVTGGDFDYDSTITIDLFYNDTYLT